MARTLKLCWSNLFFYFITLHFYCKGSLSLFRSLKCPNTMILINPVKWFPRPKSLRLVLFPTVAEGWCLASLYSMVPSKNCQVRLKKFRTSREKATEISNKSRKSIKTLDGLTPEIRLQASWVDVWSNSHKLSKFVFGWVGTCNFFLPSTFQVLFCLRSLLVYLCFNKA
jgi:hypothetical protein